MSAFVIPSDLIDAINRRLDRAIEDCPEAAKDREFLYDQCLLAVDRYGYIPEFSLEKINEKGHI